MTDPAQAGHVPRDLADEHDARFLRLYDVHEAFVWRALHAHGVEATLRCDLAQEVWVVVHRRLPELPRDEDFRPWAWTILRNVVRQHRRTTWRAQRRVRALRAVHRDEIQQSPEARVHARRTLENVVSSLPSEQREVLLLSCRYGLTGPELADLLDVPVNTIYSRLRLARAHVEREIADLSPTNAPSSRDRKRCLAAVGLGGTTELEATLPGASSNATAGWTWAAAAAAVLVAVFGPWGAPLWDARPRSDWPEQTLPAPVPASSGSLQDLQSSAAPGRSPTEPSGPNLREPEHDESSESVNEGADTRVETDEPARRATGSRSARAESDDASLDARGRRAEHARSDSESDQATTEEGGSPLARELELLTPAREALKTGRSEDALSFLNMHATRYPDSDLWDLRDAGRIAALCRLDRTSEARRVLEQADSGAGTGAPAALRTAWARCEAAFADVASDASGEPEANSQPTDGATTTRP